MEDSDLRSRIEKLNRIGIALSSETKVSRLHSLIVREARGFTRADAGSLYIKCGDVLQFEVVQNDTLDQRGCEELAQFKPYPLPLTRRSIAGSVALTGEVVNICDVAHLADSNRLFFNEAFDRRNDYQSKSMLVVPMKDQKGHVLGVLQLINALDDEGRVIPFGKEYETLVLSLASQAAVAYRNARLLDSIKKLFNSLVRYSASAIDARSPHTAGHSRRVACLAERLALIVNQEENGSLAHVHFSTDELEELSYAAWLHDIGKIGVREHVLEKAAKLNADRMALIRSRFNEISMGIRLEYQEKIHLLPGVSPNEIKSASRLVSERDQRLASIEETWTKIEKWNQPGRLTEDDLAALNALGDLTYNTPGGARRSFLEPYEIANLSIRKGNLTSDEYREIQSHVVHTAKIVSKIPFTPELSRVPFFAASHHEMLDGTGYPNGLKGDEIPIQARILAVVDIFDALVARDRPYRKAVPLDKALGILREEAGLGRLDSDLVDLFIREEIWTEEDPDFIPKDWPSSDTF